MTGFGTAENCEEGVGKGWREEKTDIFFING